MMYTSRVPRVTTRPVLAPFRSMSVLMAMVEPWISTSTAAAERALLRMQSMTPCPSSAGVVRLLACTNRRSASSNPIRSVKVPPISMATTSTLGDSSAPHPGTDAAPGTRSGFQRCAGLPHRAGHGQALENQRYFGKRQGPRGRSLSLVCSWCLNIFSSSRPRAKRGPPALDPGFPAFRANERCFAARPVLVKVKHYEEMANADVACGCGDDLSAVCGRGRARGELSEQTGDDHRAGGARRSDRCARPHPG